MLTATNEAPIFTPRPSVQAQPISRTEKIVIKKEHPLLKKIREAGAPAQKNGKHLVLDLDETLIHTFTESDNYPNFANELNAEQASRVHILKFMANETLHTYVRPYVEDFLRVAFDEFETVGVWSAGTREYVNLIVNILFKDQKPHFVMSRDQCNEVKLRDETYPCRFKPLDVIYRRYPSHNSMNTVIVDDRDDICEFNCLNNIRVPEFVMDNGNYDYLIKDTSLLLLAEWFQKPAFRNAKDVRVVKSGSPFKL